VGFDHLRGKAWVASRVLCISSNATCRAFINRKVWRLGDERGGGPPQQSKVGVFLKEWLPDKKPLEGFFGVKTILNCWMSLIVKREGVISLVKTTLFSAAAVGGNSLVWCGAKSHIVVLDDVADSKAVLVNRSKSKHPA
jgi:hypothetical protein